MGLATVSRACSTGDWCARRSTLLSSLRGISTFRDRLFIDWAISIDETLIDIANQTIAVLAIEPQRNVGDIDLDSMGHESWYRHRPQHLAGDAAQNPLLEPRVAVGSHHQHVEILVGGQR
jgi:hypothetical protein